MRFRSKQSVIRDDNLTELCSIMNVILLTILICTIQASPAPPQDDSVPIAVKPFGEKLSSYYLDSNKGQGSFKKTSSHNITNNTFSNGVQEGPYKKGGMPLISDSLFSLVILIYVS